MVVDLLPIKNTLPFFTPQTRCSRKSPVPEALEGPCKIPAKKMARRPLLRGFPGFRGTECELGSLSVLPEYRHHGIGGRLLRRAMKTAAERGCAAPSIPAVLAFATSFQN
ncbi:MAG: GNAT family N-acetyltransferase [Treponema sp.]|nr:GNAT family N-acetyltransferase [Treponema sp.]